MIHDASGHGRYLTLDALRGIAAMAVVVVHIPEMFGIQEPPSCGLAVDLFFLLSGFVVEHAYGGWLRNGLSFASFVKLRMIRLYPVYLLGLCAYSLLCFLNPHSEAWKVSIGTALALFYLPTPTAISFDPKHAFPINPVSWSLFCELAVNFAYALVLVLVRARVTTLVFVVITAALLLICERLMYAGDRSQAGVWLFVLDGMIRATYSFFMGTAIKRLSGTHAHGRSLLAVAGLVCIFAVNFDTSMQTWYELLIVLIVLPAMLSYAAFAETSNPFLRSLYHKLGAISYPVYALHMPLILFVSAGFPRLFGVHLPFLAPWSGISIICVVLLTAYLVDRIYDVPIRNLLRARSYFRIRTQDAGLPSN